MNYSSDTIAAISTPAGTGGIAVIRVSGKDAVPIVSEILRSRKKIETTKTHSAIFGRIFDGDKLLDEVVVTVFRNPHSYTGEDVVEISCHGSRFISRKILKLLLRKTRSADPGEFTQRAFLNNRIDLTQAEAIGDLIASRTEKSHQVAIEQLEGNLFHKIESMLKELTEYRTLLELEIDFFDQDIRTFDLSRIQEGLIRLSGKLQKLVGSAAEGMILKEGLKISLIGAPNVGKSSIFNAFLQSERAIVTPHPGTTRDYLEEAVSSAGYLIRIFDTAGIRNTSDHTENLGIERSFNIIERSDYVVYIIDGKENQKEYRSLLDKIDKDRIIKVLNKSDLFAESELSDFRRKGYLICSATNKNGLKDLKQKLLEKIEISAEAIHDGLLTNTRQIAAVEKAIESIRKAIESLKKGLGVEFTAFDLKTASSALEEMIGKITSDDILNRIFENFCIGK